MPKLPSSLTCCRALEHTVQRYDAHAVAYSDLRRGQFTGDALHSADCGIKLANDMDNIRVAACGAPRCRIKPALGDRTYSTNPSQFAYGSAQNG